MATLGDVIGAVMPRAVSLGPEGRGDERPVGWVRTMRARVPAFDALEPGDLILVPEGALRTVVHDEADANDVSDELRRAHVAAVVLLPPVQATGASGEAGGWPGAGPAFFTAVLQRGIPSFRLDEADEGPLERSVIGYLVNERAELDHQVTRLEAELQALALGGHGVEAMAATIAGFFRRAVAVEDGGGLMVALHAPPDPPEAAVAAARFERQRPGGGLSVELPGGGRLVLLGGRPTELERAAVERIAVVLALELARDAAMRRAQDRRREVLPAAGPPWVVLMTRQVGPGEDVPLEERERRRVRVRRLAPASRLVLRGDATSIELRAVAATTPDDPLGHRVAARVAGVMDRPVAVSKPFRDAAARAPAEAEARSALDAGDELALVRPVPSVLRADRLGVYRLLGSVHNLPDGQRHARTLLEPLLVGSPARQRARLATLRVLLDGAGAAEAAAALGIHRNTLAYRLRRIEALTGWDLGDPDLRFALALALRIVQSP